MSSTLSLHALYLHVLKTQLIIIVEIYIGLFRNLIYENKSGSKIGKRK
jgi:hypothetical protein